MVEHFIRPEIRQWNVDGGVFRGGKNGKVSGIGRYLRSLFNQRQYMRRLLLVPNGSVYGFNNDDSAMGGYSRPEREMAALVTLEANRMLNANGSCLSEPCQPLHGFGQWGPERNLWAPRLNVTLASGELIKYAPVVFWDREPVGILDFSRVPAVKSVADVHIWEDAIWSYNGGIRFIDLDFGAPVCPPWRKEKRRSW
jgi:hypothetical protein